MIQKTCPHEPKGPLSFRHQPVAHSPGSKFCWTCGGQLINLHVPSPPSGRPGGPTLDKE